MTTVGFVNIVLVVLGGWLFKLSVSCCRYSVGCVTQSHEPQDEAQMQTRHKKKLVFLSSVVSSVLHLL